MKNGILLLFSIPFILLILSCIPSSRQGDASDSQPSTEEILVIGQKYYHLRGCIKCHGRVGEGDGYRTAGLPPDQAPRNFRNVSDYRQGSDPEAIAFSIRNGITNKPPVARRGLMGLFSTNTTSSSGMPPYPHLTDEEIGHIAQYVYYLQTNQYRGKP